MLDVEGMKVESVNGGGNQIVIILDDESCFSIGMADDDYSGPEAIVLKRDGKDLVVWN